MSPIKDGNALTLPAAGVSNYAHLNLASVKLLVTGRPAWASTAWHELQAGFWERRQLFCSPPARHCPRLPRRRPLRRIRAAAFALDTTRTRRPGIPVPARVTRSEER